MRIDTIHVDKYGGLNEMNLKLVNDFQVIKGLNEEGKTTLLAFIRGVFFGFSKVFPHLKMRSAPFYTGERMGGRIEVTVELDGKERRYAIIRHTEKKQDGELSIRDLESNKLTEGGEAVNLRNLILGGVDKTLFDSVFVLTVDDLHDLKALTQDEVAHALFSADSGLGLELPRELSAMQEQMSKLYIDGKKHGKQRQRILTADLNRLTKEIGGLNQRMKKLSGQRGAREKMNNQLEELRRTRSGLSLDVKRATDRIKAREHKSRIDGLKDEIDELPDGPFPIESDQERLESLRKDIASLEEDLGELSEEIESLENKQSNLALDPDAEESHSSLEAVRVSDLVERIADVESANSLRKEKKGLSDLELEEGFEKRLKETQSRHEEIGAKIEDITEREDIANISLSKHEPKVLDAGLASEIEAAITRRYSQHSDPLDQAKGEVKRIENDLKAALKSAGGIDAEVLGDLPLDAASISRLRASLSESGSTARSRFSQIHTLIALSALFLGLCIAFFLDEILGGGGLALIGLLLLILDRLETQGSEGAAELSGSAKRQLKILGLSPNASAKDLDRLVNSLSGAIAHSEELSRAKSSRDKVEELYTAGIGLLNRLVDDCGLEAVDEGASAAYLEGVLEDIMETHRNAKAQVAVQNEELTKIRTSKRNFSRQLEDNAKKLEDILTELDEEDLESVTAVLTEITRRSEIELELERLDSAQSVVEKIREAVNAACKSVGDGEPSLQNLAIVHAKQLKRAKKAVEARYDHDKWEVRLKEKRPLAKRREKKKQELEAAATDLLESFELGSDDEMGPAIEVGKHRHKLEFDRKHEQDQFTNLAKHWDKSENDFEDEIEGADPFDDEAICTEQKLRDESLGKEIDELQGKLDSLSAELINLDESDELTRKLADKKAKQAELNEVNLHWAHLFLVQFIIQRTREKYEGSHGSEVLIRASEHLKRITVGKYTQILRVVEDPGYQLVESSGSYLPPIPPHLSRAAFAQVYLCIRLAYAEKGTHSSLPIILDDAYEGYDDERVPPALDILGELGKARQVILFSHHGHICEAAKERGAPVIQL